MNDLIVYTIVMIMLNLGIKCLVTKSQKASKRRCAQDIKMFKKLYYLQYYNTCCSVPTCRFPILSATFIHYVLI